MRTYFLAVVLCPLAASANARQVEKPIGDPLISLTCRGLDEVTVYPGRDPALNNRRVFEASSKALFRLSSGKLYISRPDQKEYLYQPVRARSGTAYDNRYVSGDYNLVFDQGNGYRKAVFVLVEEYATIITNVICTAGK